MISISATEADGSGLVAIPLIATRANRFQIWIGSRKVIDAKILVRRPSASGDGLPPVLAIATGINGIIFDPSLGIRVLGRANLGFHVHGERRETQSRSHAGNAGAASAPRKFARCVSGLPSSTRPPSRPPAALSMIHHLGTELLHETLLGRPEELARAFPATARSSAESPATPQVCRKVPFKSCCAVGRFSRSSVKLIIETKRRPGPIFASKIAARRSLRAKLSITRTIGSSDAGASFKTSAPAIRN